MNLLKKSSIHKFKQGDKFIVLDVCSGGVHLVDEMTFDVLDFAEPPMTEKCPADIYEKLPKYSPADIDEVWAELYALSAEKMLFTEDDYAKYAETSVKAPIKAMCLHVSHDCNLRCKYCFASTGDFGKGRMLMTPEVAKKSMDFLVKNSQGRVNLEVDFFGGEPLMAWDTVVETVEYARGLEKQYNKNFRFTMTTNGVLLDDEKIEYLNREMVNVVLSLDGRKEVNDRMRPSPNGKGSYDTIVPRFKKLVAGRTTPGRTDYYIRGTFTKYNIDFTEDVLHMNDIGFDQISVEPVVTDPAMPYALTLDDIPRISEEYDKLYDVMEKGDRKFRFFHFNIDLNQGPCVIKRLRGCGCGNEYVSVTPDGDVFPCHQFVGIDEWKMGTVYGETLDPNIKDYFAKTHIYSKKGCSECWARFYCSGGCNANAFIYEGDVRKPHTLSCELMKKRIECAIALKCDKDENEQSDDITVRTC